MTRLQAPSGTGGACLVGDAVHVGPPDLGQGVNAALEDVFALYEAFLKGKASGSTVAEMLARYEEAHLEDAKVRACAFAPSLPSSSSPPLRRFPSCEQLHCRPSLPAVLPTLCRLRCPPGRPSDTSSPSASPTSTASP